MTGLFSPAVHLMDRCRFAVKFLITAALAGALLVGLLYYVVSRTTADIVFTQGELVGEEYLARVRQGMLLLQQHRGLSGTLLNGDTSAGGKVRNTETDVDKAFAAIEEVGGANEALLRSRESWSAIIVRKLAEKSASAVNEIDGVTRALNDRTQLVGAGIRRGLDSLASCQQYMETVAEALAHANQAVERTSTGMSGIAASVREQTSASDSIARNVERIAGMAEENMRAVNAANQRAQSLEALAERLRGAVREFRV